MSYKINIDSSLSIMLVDDHVMFLESMAELLNKMINKCEVYYNNDVRVASIELAKNKYDFLLCDIMLPNMDTQDFIVEARKKHPLLIILLVSSVMDIRLVKQYFELGVNGFVSKAVGLYELKQAFEQTYGGGTYISTDLGGRFVNHYLKEKDSELTSKELEVLRLMSMGHSVKKTAVIMHISPFTVSSHRRSIMSKLGLHSAAELIKYVFENKLE